MSDPITIVARAAARRLETEGRRGLAAEVEAALAARESPSTPPHYGDPVALASLIVIIATLVWTIYTDLKKRIVRPAAEVLTQTVRVRLLDAGQAGAPDHIIDIVVTETIRAAVDQENIED